MLLLQSNNEEEEMSDPELMPEEEEEISGEEGIPRGINGIQRQNSPPPPAELLAKLKQQVSQINTIKLKKLPVLKKNVHKF
jgi:hypothetical protein